VDEKTEVVLLNGQAGKVSDLKIGQWIRAYWNPDPSDPKQQRIVKIEPSMPSWAVQRLADLEKSVGSLEVAVRVFINGKGDEEELHLLGPDNEGGYKEPFFARLTKDDMAKLLRYLAVEGFLADAMDGAAGDGKLPLPAPPYVRLAVGKFYQAVSWTPDTVRRLEGIKAVLPDKAAAKMSGLLAKVREKVGGPTTQAAGTRISGKGWEVYIWQEKDVMLFALLPGTNRLKSNDEIAQVAVKDIDSIRRQLDQLKVGQFITVNGQRLGGSPPAEQGKAVAGYCKKIGLDVLR
jgi:hypothetical protein